MTGASSGIGEALARALAVDASGLTLVARRRDRLEALAASLRCPCHVVAADLSRADQATEWLPAAEAVLGPVQVLVNNAGRQIVGPTRAGTPDDGEHLLRLNVHTPLRLIQTVLPAMQDRGSGVLVNVASLAALAPTPGMTYYSASKAALAAASEALHGEVRQSGVHVLTVYPGPIHTEMADAAVRAYGPHAEQVGRLPTGTPEGLAQRVLAAIRRRQRRVIYPAVYRTAHWFPSLTHWTMARFSPLPE